MTAIIQYISVHESGQGIFFQLPQARVVTKAWFVDQLRSVSVLFVFSAITSSIVTIEGYLNIG